MDRQDDALVGRGRVATSRGRDRRGPQVDRRDLLRSAAGAGLGAASVASLGLAGWGFVAPAIHLGGAAAAAPLQEPPVRASRNGLLDTTLEAKVRPVSLAGKTVN